jgi:hypothetical protein
MMMSVLASPQKIQQCFQAFCECHCRQEEELLTLTLLFRNESHNNGGPAQCKAGIINVLSCVSSHAYTASTGLYPTN